MAVAIKVENLSKAYQLGEIGTGTLSRDLERWFAKVRGKEDPFLKIGETNDRTSKSSSDVVWSLKDIDFKIQQGDAVGIIGRNGAGKSTLLKLLSRVTSPTTGSIKVKGRIASLLEVGTGFHPELTGRENIYLNGAILGMRKKEITRKFDEIVDFAGVERYIDTPVKRYSSGMYVRLAFAVAAHLDSEILIVDEVLAVGDAEFQKKCLGKMGEVSRGEGRTVLFVSHNVAAVRQLCNTGILLKRGQILTEGKIENVLSKYIQEDEQLNKMFWKGEDGNEEFKLLELRAEPYSENNVINNSEEIKITAVFKKCVQDGNLVIAINLISSYDAPILRIQYNDFKDFDVSKPGIYSITFKIPKYTLATGKYKVRFDLAQHTIKKYNSDISNIYFEVVSSNGIGDKFSTEDSFYHNSQFRPDWCEDLKLIHE